MLAQGSVQTSALNICGTEVSTVIVHLVHGKIPKIKFTFIHPSLSLKKVLLYKNHNDKVLWLYLYAIKSVIVIYQYEIQHITRAIALFRVSHSNNAAVCFLILMELSSVIIRDKSYLRFPLLVQKPQWETSLIVFVYYQKGSCHISI